MSLLRLTLVLLLAAGPLMAGGKKDHGTTIALHVEANRGDHPKMIFRQFVAGETRLFHRVPEVSTRDIAAFKPFPSKSGAGYGLLLQLKRGPTNRLSGITAANLSKWMIARINGRIVDGVLIDSQINDGQWVIWKGVSAVEIAELDKTMPRIGQKKPRG